MKHTKCMKKVFFSHWIAWNDLLRKRLFSPKIPNSEDALFCILRPKYNCWMLINRLFRFNRKCNKICSIFITIGRLLTPLTFVCTKNNRKLILWHARKKQIILEEKNFIKNIKPTPIKIDRVLYVKYHNDGCWLKIKYTLHSSSSFHCLKGEMKRKNGR